MCQIYEVLSVSSRTSLTATVTVKTEVKIDQGHIPQNHFYSFHCLASRCEYPICFCELSSTLYFELFVISNKLEQDVCIKFCVKLVTSATETLEMLYTFSDEALNWTMVLEWHLRFMEGRLHSKMSNIQSDEILVKHMKMWHKLENSYKNIVA